MSTRNPISDAGIIGEAKNAKNGAKFERLWSGSTAGYESQSEAELALCCLLAFWTSNDTERMDRLFRESGLYREKWDEVHYADGSTYGEKTIANAVQVLSETYEQDAGDLGVAANGSFVSVSYQGPQCSPNASTYLGLVSTALNENLQSYGTRLPTFDSPNSRVLNIVRVSPNPEPKRSQSRPNNLAAATAASRISLNNTVLFSFFLSEDRILDYVSLSVSVSTMSVTMNKQRSLD